jgi:hypothetical protein
VLERTFTIRSRRVLALSTRQISKVVRLIWAGWFALAVLAVSPLALAGEAPAGAPDASPRVTDAPPGVTDVSPATAVQIASISYEPQEIRRGDTVLAEVVCTSNTEAVTAQVGWFHMAFAKTAPGIFQMSFRVPRSRLVHSHQTVLVTATGADGATAQRRVPIEIH